MTRCPHKNIVHCPLYHAAHMAIGMGCDDGGLQESMGEECAITRGLDYAAAVARFRAAEPVLVAQLEWKEAAAAGKEQRLRNMRILGLH